MARAREQAYVFPPELRGVYLEMAEAWERCAESSPFEADRQGLLALAARWRELAAENPRAPALVRGSSDPEESSGRAFPQAGSALTDAHKTQESP